MSARECVCVYIYVFVRLRVCVRARMVGVHACARPYVCGHVSARACVHFSAGAQQCLVIYV